MNLALRKAQENCTESYLLTEGLKLERELNAANSIIRQQQLLDEENLRLQDRIKLLEEAGDALFENSNPSRWDSPADAARKLTEQSNWIKAKEANP
jgi:hypothetical protein